MWYDDQKKAYAKLPQVVQMWIQQGRNYMISHIGAKLREEVQTPEDTEQIITIPTSKEGIGPMRFLFVIDDLCEEQGGLSDVPPDDRKYTAAYIHLPMGTQEEKLLTTDQIYLVVAHIVEQCTSPTLALQLWCNREQHSVCRTILEELFTVVEPNFWMKPSKIYSVGEKNKHGNGYLADDLLWGFIAVGPKQKEAGATGFVGGGYRPSVVFAPRVQAFSQLPGANNEEDKVYCKSELNAYLPQQFFEMYSREDDMVADFMCGSGSAAVAAASLGRSCLVVDSGLYMVCMYLLAY